MVAVIAFTPGDVVTIKQPEIQAEVNAVHIERESVQYECQWWSDGVCNTMLFFESELSGVAVQVPDGVSVDVIK